MKWKKMCAFSSHSVAAFSASFILSSLVSHRFPFENELNIVINSKSVICKFHKNIASENMFSHHRNTDNNVFFSQPSSVKHGLDTSGRYTCWWVSLSLILLFKTNVLFTTKWFVAEMSHMILLKVGSLMPLVLCPAAVGHPSRSVLSTCHLLSTVAFKALLKGVDEVLFQGGSIWAFNSCAAEEANGKWKQWRVRGGPH